MMNAYWFDLADTIAPSSDSIALTSFGVWGEGGPDCIF